MRQPRVILIGQVCIDHNTIEGHHHSSWGSPVMHMGMYFRDVLSIQPILVTPYGADFLPYANNLPLYPPQPTIANTLVYENVVTAGQRVQYCRFADIALPTPIDPIMQQMLSSADIVCVAPLTPAYSADYLKHIVAATPESCIKVILPQGYLRDIGSNGLVHKRNFVEAANVLSLFDLAILSSEDIDDALHVVQRWKQLGPKTDFIVTENSAGASVTQGDHIIHVPTEPVTEQQIQNPIGLGDVFGAATAYQLYVTGDLTRAVAMGNDAARQSLIQPAP